MAVSLLAANSPIGILLCGLFVFGVFKLEPGMNAAQVPSELVSIVTASYLLCQCSLHYRTLCQTKKTRLKEGK